MLEEKLPLPVKEPLVDKTVLFVFVFEVRVSVKVVDESVVEESVVLETLKVVEDADVDAAVTDVLVRVVLETIEVVEDVDIDVVVTDVLVRGARNDRGG